MSRVGIRAAKARFSHYVEVARAGGEVIVTDRGEPVVRLVAVKPSEARTEADVLSELADAGLVDLASERDPGPGPRPVRPRRAFSISDEVRRMRR